MARAKVPAATIRHYDRMGLLPPARGSPSRRLTYDERHVRALRLIRRLRSERNLPLSEIGRIMPDLLELGDAGLRPSAWDEALARRAEPDLLRDSLIDAAVTLFTAQGLERTSVAQIAALARVAKGSTYRDYRSKEELFVAAVDEVARRIGDSTVPSRRSSAALRDERASAARPYLPLLLDVAAGALRRRRGFASMLSRTLDRLSPAGAPHDPRDRASNVRLLMSSLERGSPTDRR